MRSLLPLLLLACATNTAATADDAEIVATAATPHIVPEAVHTWLQHHELGQHHLMFHMTRHYFIGGDSLRNWLKGQNETYANVQEGDPGSGIEFLAMHRAMIDYLRRSYGELPIDDDPEYKNFGEVLDGWKTDEMMLAAIDKHSTSKAQAKAAFPAAAARISDFSTFASDDEFGIFIQTQLRLSEANPNDSFQRNYTRDYSVGSGLHNTMHGWFQDNSSPINVGDPALNLSNKLFWGIHGWIEAKWQAYEKAHPRTAEEEATYQDLLEKFGLHLQIHDHDPDKPAPKAFPAATSVVTNDVKCRDLAPGTTVDGCQ